MIFWGVQAGFPGQHTFQASIFGRCPQKRGKRSGSTAAFGKGREKARGEAEGGGRGGHGEKINI